MKPLIAEEFQNDPRVAQAKALLLEALKEHQARLAAPHPGDPARKEGYDELLHRFSRLRAGPLYFPYLGSGIGRGPLVELADGSVKYDMISGIGVHHFGHGHPLFVEAALDAATRDTVMQGNLQQNIGSADLAQLLVESAARHGSHIAHCFFTTSGAMANENALKLIFQKKAPAHRVLAFERCFMGRSLALSNITDNPAYRQGLPGVLAVDYVPFFNPHRPTQSRDEAVAAIKHHVDRHPGEHALMGMEMVQGEGGYHPGDSDFFHAITDLLRAKGIAVLVDEVQTFGRTHELFAFQHYGLDKQVDVVTIGKLSQVCATLFTDEYQPKPGLISQTFTGSTSAILAGMAAVKALLAGDFFGAQGRNARVFQRFSERLRAIASEHPSRVSAISGVGGMIAFTPFDGSADVARQCTQTLFDMGLICFTAGHDPTRLRLLPPVGAITDADINVVCTMIEAGLARVAQTQ